jgi:hypothetical protein
MEFVCEAAVEPDALRPPVVPIECADPGVEVALAAKPDDVEVDSLLHGVFAITADRFRTTDRGRAECLPPLAFRLAQRDKIEWVALRVVGGLAEFLLAQVSAGWRGEGIADSQPQLPDSGRIRMQSRSSR